MSKTTKAAAAGAALARGVHSAGHQEAPDGQFYLDIHVVFSGFNEAFRTYFKGDDPKATIEKFAEVGKVVVRPTKGGAIIYDSKDNPPKPPTLGETICKILG